MAYTHSRKFLCLPVRFGVIIMAVISVIVGGILGTGAWVEVAHMAKLAMPTQLDMIALCIHASVYTILLFISVFGIIAAILQNQAVVSAYSIAVMAHIVISIGSGILYIFSLLRKHKQEDVDKCINGSSDELTQQLCGKGVAIFNGVAVGILCGFWLLHLYGCIVVSNYRAQLEDTKPGLRSVLIGRPQGPVMKNTYDSFIAGRDAYVANHPLPYAFTQPLQSYGAENANNV